MIEISVIMSTRSRPEKLANAIESILNQTLKSLELLVIDDGSTDATREVLKHYSEIDSRVRVFRFEEGCAGVIALRYNFGFQQAKGNYIAQMFDDDLLLPFCYERLLNEIQSRQLDMVYGNLQFIWQTSVGQFPVGTQGVLGKQWGSEILTTNIVPIPCVLIKKSTLLQLGCLDTSPTLIRINDWDLWRRAYKANCKVSLVEQVVAIGHIANEDSIGLNYSVDYVKAIDYMNSSDIISERIQE